MLIVMIKNPLDCLDMGKYIESDYLWYLPHKYLMNCSQNMGIILPQEQKIIQHTLAVLH